MKFGVVVFPGSNCDRDMYDALRYDLNQEVIMLWHKDKDLSQFTIFITITENDLAVHFQLVQCFFIGIITALTMRHGYFINIVAVCLNKNIFANELLIAISQ